MSQTSSGRLIIVSNRLPVTIRREGGKTRLEDSPGGLATGLRPFHESGRSLWLGWPGDGDRVQEAPNSEVEPLLDARRLVPVHLTAQDVHRYYDGFSNGVIWPLFHYLLDRVPQATPDWEGYRLANRAFAEIVARHAEPGDTIWVHDYQLMLLPALIRHLVPQVRIGFFLHIPFPSSELFRILPWRRELLEGMLGSDLVGFHTHGYVRHFVVALRQILGLEPGLDRVAYQGREVKFAHLPMGIDVGRIDYLARAGAVTRVSAAVRRDSGGRQVLLGIDRLDYTKGIPRRLLAFERLLDREPALRTRVRLIQVAVPSRTGTEPYQAVRRQVEEIVGRINGRFGTLGLVPVHYLYQGVSPSELVGLYRATDVMLVTPLRDGMNLVSKEFVASRIDEDGVLVLSEFAGAAAELGEAVSVNPFDVDGMAEAFRQALLMPASERRTRMRAMRQRVSAQTVHQWARAFLGLLGEARLRARRPVSAHLGNVDDLVERLRRSNHVTLLLDYDGTLVPFTAVPDLASPDEDLLDLLSRLVTSSPGSVHVVSGRPPRTLDEWLGQLQLDLWAEHGAWHRPEGSTVWTCTHDAGTEWLTAARPILDRFTAATPGALVEAKSRSLAWHYRMVDRELGADRARQLRRALASALHADSVEILNGHKVVEVRARGIDKGLVVRHVLSRVQPAPTILAIGDDRTDEDMFAALPDGHGFSVRVGPGPSAALHRLPDPNAVRDLVRRLIA